MHKFGGVNISWESVLCLVYLSYVKKKKKEIKVPLFLYFKQASSQDYVCYPHVILRKSELKIWIMFAKKKKKIV